MRFLVIGDTHGDFAWMQSKVIKRAKRDQAEAVVQVGDFGFIWSCDDDEVTRRLDNLNRHFAEAGLPLYWLDGNHENFETMERFGAKPDAPEMVQLRSHITYLPRGVVWEWGGVRFMALGGAHSVDVSHRVPFISWWPEERITHADIHRALDSAPDGVDVMLTHDSPHYEELNKFLTSFNLPLKMEEQSRANRRALDGVVDALKPKLLVHGHYHHRLSGQRDGTTIVGLNHSKHGAEAQMILDTETLDEQIAELRNSKS